LVAVLSERLDRAAILDAIRARRTYAITGDRIEIDFEVNGAPMGATIEAGSEVEAAYRVNGRDELDIVEVIQDGEIVHRSFPRPHAMADRQAAQTFQVRFEWGWGPWGDLALERTADWKFDIAVEGGRIRRIFPCLQSGPFDDQRRHRVEQISESAVSVRSFTSRRGAYRQNPNQSLVLELEGSLSTALALELSQPVVQKNRSTVAELTAGSYNGFTGPFPNEGYQFHRIVPLAASSLADKCTIAVPDRRSHVYLRVRQQNGQMAWVSPVFLNYR
jgi:hypothetical protein